jgi:hypothetical protein
VSLGRAAHDQQVHRLEIGPLSLVRGGQRDRAPLTELDGDHLRELLGVTELGVIDHQGVHLFTSLRTRRLSVT